MNKNEPNIHAFVISWAGKHANSIDIAEKIQKQVSRTTIIYSDPDSEISLPSSCETVRVPDEWFWGRKFKACLDLCESDLMLVIQGDVSCDNWDAAIDRCVRSFACNEKIGVYAPTVDYSYFDLNKTCIERLNGTSLSVVALVDGITFAISRPVVNRLKNLRYDENNYGWGILWAAVSYAYSHGLIAVLDDSVKVSHPKSRGYDSGAAHRQMVQFLQQLSPEERVQYKLLKSHIGYQRRRGYLRYIIRPLLRFFA
jgi:hypothetical protein